MVLFSLGKCSKFCMICFVLNVWKSLQVENVLRKQTGDFVLCDYGSAHFGVIDPQVCVRIDETKYSCQPK